MKLTKETRMMLGDVRMAVHFVLWASMHLLCWFSMVVALAGVFVYSLILGWSSANLTWLVCVIVAVIYSSYFWRKNVKTRLQARNWK